MNKPLALTAYLAGWAALAGGVIYWMVRSGYSPWAAVASAYLLFLFLNGTLAYRSRAKFLRSEGKEPPSYFRYLFFPTGIPKLKENASRSTHFIVGIFAVVAGTLLVLCGIALTLDAEWSRISNPLLAAILCFVPTGIGTSLLYIAWRLFTYHEGGSNNVA